jgi:catechol 2,3-dioxygenase-like lactoylglutathione lyase family enzyme
MQRTLSGDRPFRLRSETTALFLPGFPMFPRSTRAASCSLLSVVVIRQKSMLIGAPARARFAPMEHLALAVSDQERSRRFYETYFGFDAHPPRRYDDGVLMLYNRDGFSLALGPTDEPIRLPAFLHFGVRLPSPEAVREFRKRLAADGIPIAEEWDEPEYVSVKCRDPDGYVVEAAWEPSN